MKENKEEYLAQVNDFSGSAIFPLVGHSEEQVQFQVLPASNGRSSQLNSFAWSLFDLKWKTHFHTNMLMGFEWLFQLVFYIQEHAKVAPKSRHMVCLQTKLSERDLYGDQAGLHLPWVNR